MNAERVAPEGDQFRGAARARHAGRRARHAVLSRWDILLVIAFGGAAGAAARYGVGELWPHGSGEFPWSTFLVNVTGCFLVGGLMVFVVDVWPSSRYARPLLGVGFLGGYTTFSAYALESRDLLAAGRQQVAGTYLALSLVAGLTAVWLGIVIARLVLRTATGVARRRRTHRVRDPRDTRSPSPSRRRSSPGRNR